MSRLDSSVRVHVNPTPSVIIEPYSEPGSPYTANPFLVSPKVVAALSAHANEVKHVTGIEQLFHDLASVVLSRRSNDPEQLLMDYLTSKRLPELQKLPHHRASSSNMTDRTVTDDTIDFPGCSENTDGLAIVHKKTLHDEGLMLEERLAAHGATAMHRTVLANMARLLLSARPHDIEDFLVTRWEGETFGEGDAISVEASSPPHATTVVEQLSNHVPVGTVGWTVTKKVAKMLLSKKPSNPLNALFVYFDSRLGNNMGRTGDSFCFENPGSTGGNPTASLHLPGGRLDGAPLKTVLDGFRKRTNDKNGIAFDQRSSSNFSNASDSGRRQGRTTTFLTSSLDGHRLHADECPGSSRSVGRNRTSASSLSAGRREYFEDPLIEVSCAMKRNMVLKSPPPPLSYTEMGGSLRGAAADVRKKSPPHFSKQQDHHMFQNPPERLAYLEEAEEDDEQDLVTGPAASFATLKRELGIFQAKRELRLEMLRDEVDSLRLEKSYREMVMRKRPSEEATAALENVTSALEDAEVFLQSFELRYKSSLQSMTKWIRRL